MLRKWAWSPLPLIPTGNFEHQHTTEGCWRDHAHSGDRKCCAFVPSTICGLGFWTVSDSSPLVAVPVRFEQRISRFLHRTGGRFLRLMESQSIVQNGCDQLWWPRCYLHHHQVFYVFWMQSDEANDFNIWWLTVYIYIHLNSTVSDTHRHMPCINWVASTSSELSVFPAPPMNWHHIPSVPFDVSNHWFCYQTLLEPTGDKLFQNWPRGCVSIQQQLC